MTETMIVALIALSIGGLVGYLSNRTLAADDKRKTKVLIDARDKALHLAQRKERQARLDADNAQRRATTLENEIEEGLSTTTEVEMSATITELRAQLETSRAALSKAKVALADARSTQAGTGPKAVTVAQVKAGSAWYRARRKVTPEKVWDKDAVKLDKAMNGKANDKGMRIMATEMRKAELLPVVMTELAYRSQTQLVESELAKEDNGAFKGWKNLPPVTSD